MGLSNGMKIIYQEISDQFCHVLILLNKTNNGFNNATAKVTFGKEIEKMEWV